VSKLIGKDATIVQKVIKELKFAPGAHLVCSTLKRMGVRLAVLTNTGVCEVMYHVKKELGIDYALCRDLEVVDGKFTGQYTGDLSDVCFRKSDLLKLMADREGIADCIFAECELVKVCLIVQAEHVQLCVKFTCHASFKFGFAASSCVSGSHVGRGIQHLLVLSSWLMPSVGQIYSSSNVDLR